MLVNKLFYGQACTVWFDNITIKLSSPNDLHALPSHSLRRIKRLHVDVAARGYMEKALDLEYLDRCFSLRHLTITLDCSLFDYQSDKIACLDDFGPEDFCRGRLSPVFPLGIPTSPLALIVNVTLVIGMGCPETVLDPIQDLQEMTSLR